MNHIYVVFKYVLFVQRLLVSYSGKTFVVSCCAGPGWSRMLRMWNTMSEVCGGAEGRGLGSLCFIFGWCRLENHPWQGCWERLECPRVLSLQLKQQFSTISEMCHPSPSHLLPPHPCFFTASVETSFVFQLCL